MAIYEKRTYTVQVGKMPEVIELYKNEGWTALEKGGFAEKNHGYFISDVGTLHQLVHIWKFEDDAERRDFWKRLFSDEDFMAFAVQLRPMIQNQEVQLLLAAPWGNHP